VESNAPSYEDLEKAEKSAAALGADEISNSWAGSEEGETPALESAGPFNHPGIVITAAAGDDGYLNWDSESSAEKGYVNFPASSPHVVAVGGTRLSLGAGSAWAGETVWNGDHASGGGCSVEFTAQPWQQSVLDWSAVGCATKRAVADVAADADPYTGFAVHDTSPECEYQYEEAKVRHVAYWCTIGGTSLASPLIASVFALAGGANGAAYPAKTLYENELKSPASLHDITVGSNGECTKPFLEEGLSACTPAEEAATSCASKAICLAGTGYDGATGVGTPDGINAFKPPADQPTAVTGATSLVTPGSASVSATVNPNGQPVSECSFQYGATEAYGASVPCSASPGSGESPVAVSASLTGLAADSTYHYRIVATNLAGTSYGSDQTLKTLTGVSGCTDYWANTAGGSWYTAGNWSTGSPPHSGEGACILANGTYSVTLEQTGSSGTVSLQLLKLGGSEGSQTLLLAGTCSQSAELTTSTGISNGSNGTITMTNGDSCANNVTLTGPVSNAGMLNVEDPQGGTRSINGNLTNTHRVSLAAGASLHVTGNFTQTHTGWIRDLIAGTSNFGSLSVSGATTLEGALVLFQTAPFRASLGESFAIIDSTSPTGAFVDESGDQIGSGLYYKPTYSTTGVTLLVAQATLALSKASGLPDSSVKLSGSGYIPGDTLTPTFTSSGGVKTSFSGVKANAKGELETEITIPTLAAEGAGSISLTSTETGVILTKAFTVS
jgi:hypothetical protein